jgi:LysM repeat protein
MIVVFLSHMKHLLTLFSCLFCASVMMAQGLGPIEKINGVEYYIHSVEKGQTLYSISRMYHVDPNTVVKENNLSGNNVGLGQKLKIKKNDLPPSMQTPPQEQLTLPNFTSAKDTTQEQTHVVQQGETAYSIAKKYNLSLDDFYTLNPGTELSLSLNQVVKVKVPKRSMPVVGETKVNLSKSPWDVAVILPFFSSRKDSISDKQRKMREVSLQLYRGIRLATDSLKKAGLKANVRVLDCGDSKALAEEYVKNGKLKGTDLIIGPLFKEPAEVWAKWAHDNNAWVVCPVPITNKVLMGNDRLVKAFPSDVSLWASTARFVHETWGDMPVYLLQGKTESEKKRQIAFGAGYKSAGGKPFVSSVNVDSLIQVLANKTEPCVWIVPLATPAVVSKILQQAGRLKHVHIIGMEEWRENPLLDDPECPLVFLYPRPYEQLDEDPDTERWMDAFHRAYLTDPNEYAMCGYDIMMAWGQRHIKGKDDLGAFPMDYGGLNCNIELMQIGAGNGYENIGLMMIQSEHGTLRRIK